MSLLLLALMLIGGCAAPRAGVENPTRIAASEYDRVFEEAVEVLRDYRFRVDRRDRRFGVITTEPRTAGSVLEPWAEGNQTFDQALENTIQHQRRIIRIELSRREGGEATEAASDQTVADYELLVRAQLQRRQRVTGPLNTAATSSVQRGARGGGRRVVLTERGYESDFWRDVGRDAALERTLIAAILQRATAPPPPPPPEEEGEAQAGAPPSEATPAALVAGRP
jgi:hypothetical protein